MERYESGPRENVAPPVADVVAESATADDKLTPEQRTKKERDKQIILDAIEEVKTTQRAERQFREDAKDDALVRVGTKGDKHYQWPPQVAEKRKAQGRIVVTVNRMPGFIRQVTNQARSARLKIKVSPAAGSGTERVKLAEVLQGIIRNIETDSFADRAYNKAADKQAEQGRGFFRLITEWADFKSFRQKIKIRQEKDPLAIYYDPTCQEADNSDAWFAYKITDLSPNEFKKETNEDFPTEQDISAFAGEDTDKKDWFPGGKKIRFVEQFRREFDGPEYTLVQLSTGDVIEQPDEAGLEKLKRAGITIDRTRKVRKTKMVWRRLTALKVYSETTWAGDAPPWIPVVGDENEVEGELDWRGVVRDSKQSAQLYNVEIAALLEAIGQGIKAPVIGYKGQFGAPESTTRKAWANANVEPTPFLEIEPVTIDGKPAPIPQRAEFEVPIDGVIAGLQQTDADYKSTAGWHDDSIGLRGHSDSGKAITARQRQDEVANSHYLDNLRFALCSAGRQLIKLIRVVYDVPMIIRITGNDDVARDVMVFSGAHKDPRNTAYWKTHPADAKEPHVTPKGERIQPGSKIPFELPKGVTEIYDLSVGEFDIEVSAAPDPGTRRQEQMDSLMGMFKVLRPEVTEKFLDLLFQLGDLPVFQQMADRAKKLGLGMSDDDGEMKDWPPEAQALVGKMRQELEHVKQQLQEAGMKLATKQPEIESRERMHSLDIRNEEALAKMEQITSLLEKALDRETKIAVAEVISKDKAPEFAQAEIERVGAHLEARADRTHEALEADKDRQHKADQADKDRQHAADEAAAARDAAANAQESQQQHEVQQTQAEPPETEGEG